MQDLSQPVREFTAVHANAYTSAQWHRCDALRSYSLTAGTGVEAVRISTVYTPTPPINLRSQANNQLYLTSPSVRAGQVRHGMFSRRGG